MREPALGRILVVDDELNIADSVQRALERLGYAVDVASGPEQAWSKLEQSLPEVVICDVRLHEADGMERPPPRSSVTPTS
jgi:DNA-binding response OmpR family regulator